MASKSVFCAVYVHSDGRFEISVTESKSKQLLTMNATLGVLAPFKRFLPKSCKSRPLSACEFADAADLPFVMKQLTDIYLNPNSAQKQISQAMVAFQATLAPPSPPMAIASHATSLPTGNLVALQNIAKATGWTPGHGVMCGSPDEPCGCDPHNDGLRFSICKCSLCTEAGPGHWCA